MGITKATANWGTERHGHPWIYKYLDQVYMNCVENGNVAKIFKEGNEEPKKKLVPIIYCHGLVCSRTS